MKISKNWLNEYVNIDISNEEFSQKMMLVGNEIEDMYKLSDSTNLVIGLVKDKKKHPDSDHLNVCQVDLGDEEHQIVCGAPNVDKDQKVIVAKVGAKLPNGLEIKKATIRGVESNGMICSLEELGIESKYIENKDGIHVLENDAPIGVDALKHLNYDDFVFDFSLTPDRGDLLSIIGMAYETGAILNKKTTNNDIKLNEIDEKHNINIVSNTSKCKTYLSKIVKDVTIKESPNFIKARLIASGIRPINNVVDISNYVMIEYGQPLHFFDYDKIGNEIIVRESKDKEEIYTLDGEKRNLSEGDILITNDNQILAIAGVMGGLDTEVTEQTKNIFIESAIFDPFSVRKTSKDVYRSESSIRFEKGIDPNKTLEALNRAAYLLQEYASGKPVKEVYGFNNEDKDDKEIELYISKVRLVLGMNLSEDEIESVFDKLSFKYIKMNEKYIVSVPKRRLDITIEEDLIEEIGRIHGYNNMKGTLPRANINTGNFESKYGYIRNIHNKVRSLGLNQIINYSLQNEKEFNKYSLNKYEVIKPLQPSSDERNSLRYSLIPSMLNVIEYNLFRNIKDLNLYEIGKGFYKDKTYNEENKLCIGMTGKYLNNDWEDIQVKSNYYALKGIIETLLNYLGYNNRYNFVVEEFPKEFHPFKTASIYVDDTFIGYIGAVNPTINKNEIYVCEINIDTLYTLKTRRIKYKEISKYPNIIKDVAFILNKNINSIDVLNTIKKSNTKVIKNVEVFDYYKDSSIGDDNISIGYKITFMDNTRTLTDEEVTIFFNKVIEDVLKTYQGSTLRSK